MNYRLFNATFNDSQNIFNKSRVLEDGGGFAASGRMDLKSKLTVLVLSPIFIIIDYMFGVSLPKMLLENPSGTGGPIPPEIVYWIGKIGVSLSPIVNLIVLVWIAAIILNLLIPKKLPAQIMYAMVLILGLMGMGTALTVFSLVSGLTVYGTGWLGFWIQITAGLSLWVIMIIRKRRQIIIQLYHNGQKSDKMLEWYFKFTKRFGPIIILAVVLNMYVFRLGQPQNTNPGLLALVYGWSVLLVIIIIAVTTTVMLPQFVSNYYFFKYQKQYKEKYKFTDEEWYGKIKARRLAKKAESK